MRLRAYDVIFMILSIVNVIMSCAFEITYITYALAVLLFVFKITGVINNERYILYSLFVPNKYLQLLSVFLFLIFTNKLIAKKLTKLNTIFLIYILSVGTLNCFIYNGLYVAVIFQFGVYYCILRLIDDFEEHFSFDLVVETFNKMFYLQIVSILIEYLITHETMDALTGTMISAHYLGVFLLIYAYILWKSKILLKTTKAAMALKMIILIIGLYFVDAKHVVCVFFFSIMLARIFSKLKIKNRLTITMLSITMFIVLVLWCISSGLFDTVISSYPTIATYVLNGEYNKKLQFYLNTFEQLKGLNGLLGYGVGQYGSQICLTFAKGIIYSWDTSLSGYVYAITPYADAIKGIMTQWYVEIGIVISSMVLGYPLVSFIALVAELGLVGLFIFMQILDKKFRGSEAIFIMMFLIMTNFDTYFEIPCVFVLILIAESINRKDNVFFRGRKCL